MKIRIAVLADAHFDRQGISGIPQRRAEIADILLLRAVHRLNRLIKPDVTVILGDLADRGGAADAPEHFKRLREITDILESPSIVIPGNHDGEPEAFYRFFERPAPFVEVNGFRFAHFLDREEPNWNARRSAGDIERMGEARSGFDGPVVTLQHCPLFPPGTSDCPYNYVNAEEVIAAMGRRGIGLSLSGHYHGGMEAHQGAAHFIAAPGLCEAPFAFLVVEYDGKEARVIRHELRMPEKLALVDTHVHTQFAYCAENMTMSAAVGLGRDFGLAGVAFSEHSGQLYFNNDDYWSARCLAGGIESAADADSRMERYLAAARAANCPADSLGLEADCDFRGRPLVRDADRGKVRFLVGSVHALSELMKEPFDMARVREEFLSIHERFLASGIRVLAHPFRIFRRSEIETPPELYGPLARMLAETRVAAEINFHTHEPSVEFLRMCLDAGVKITFGSDAHNLYEVGEFALHLDLVERAGFHGDLKDILIDPRKE